VAEEPELTREVSGSPAKRMSCNAYRRTAAGRERITPRRGGLVEATKRGPWTSGDSPGRSVDLNRIHQASVDHHRVAFRETLEGMASAAKRERNSVKSQPRKHGRHSAWCLAQRA